LRKLGVTSGQVLLVHASLGRLGTVRDGAAAVVTALRDVLGSEGTLVVPTGTAGNSDTSRIYLARTAGMTAEQVRRYKTEMRPFDPATTPSDGMGRIAEEVRTTPGATRSAHPQSSFAALGPMAQKLTEGHAVDCHLGESSPLARLYEVGAWVLLLGVGYVSCSAFHLAEYRYIPNPPTRRYRCVITMQGRPAWHEYEDVVLDDSDIAALGADFDRAGLAIQGNVGRADCRLAPMATMVDFASEWLRGRRDTTHL
jgi:aminoglycoside 3-N-acetyltransferase